MASASHPRVYECARMRSREYYESLAITTINAEEAKNDDDDDDDDKNVDSKRQKRLSNYEQYESIDYIKETSTRLSFSVVKQQANKYLL